MDLKKIGQKKLSPSNTHAPKLYSESLLPTSFGVFNCAVFKDANGAEHVALYIGNVEQERVLCRLHSECLTGEVFHSLRCDCRQQLERALKKIQEAKCGIILYLRQEGRGIGLGNKIKAYHHQDQGLDTVEANHQLGFEDDLRDYSDAASILKTLGIKSIELMTNNPTKVRAMEKANIIVAKRVPHHVEAPKLAKQYVTSKNEKMGHYA